MELTEKENRDAIKRLENILAQNDKAYDALAKLRAAMDKTDEAKKELADSIIKINSHS